MTGAQAESMTISFRVLARPFGRPFAPGSVELAVPQLHDRGNSLLGEVPFQLSRGREDGPHERGLSVLFRDAASCIDEDQLDPEVEELLRHLPEVLNAPHHTCE